MPPRIPRTTVPAADSTAAKEAALPPLALVIAWSASQPHRVGQIASLPFGERLFVGRGDGEPERFAHFVTHRPAETPAVDPHEDLLAGDTVSRRQLEVRSAADHLEVKRTGSCSTYVNRVKLESHGVLRPGDTLLLKRELLLLCVVRPRTLALPEGLRELHPFGEPDADGIVGESPAAWALRAQLARTAATNDDVLLRGESGTGKELAAAVIHRRSPNANGPRITRNAAAIPETLVAAELFGNLRNYPNPGTPPRPGLVGAAHGGTLFLDEIGELSAETQAQMLRVLDEGEYTVLGESHARRSDFRLVGATNRGDEVFRRDFRARMKALVRLPPLRERREDIAHLVRHLLIARVRSSPEKDRKKQKERLLCEGPGGRLEPRVSAQLVEHLLHHDLPANVRDLERILIASADASDGGPLDVPPEEPERRPGGPADRPVLPKPRAEPLAERGAQSPPKELVEALMRKYAGNKRAVARALGCSPGTLYRLLESHGIGLDHEDDPDEPE